MIVVSTGTNGAAFDRLLEAVVDLQTDEEMVIQHGPSSIRRAGAKCVPSLPYAEYAELIERARVVITHAGVGSVLVSLMQGKCPILVPRLARYAEAVDDHQLELAQRLDTSKRAVAIVDVRRLNEAIHTVSDRLAAPRGRERLLLHEVAGFVADSVRISGHRSARH